MSACPEVLERTRCDLIFWCQLEVGPQFLLLLQDLGFKFRECWIPVPLAPPIPFRTEFSAASGGVPNREYLRIFNQASGLFRARGTPNPFSKSLCSLNLRTRGPES